MKTTIGVPVYNEARFLQRTLDSIAGQADQIIICDNNSTDGTEEICRHFAETRPDVRYERFKKQRGAAASFRHCLELAETEYFMWVGGHDLLVPGHVDKLKSALDQNSSLVLAYANALHLNQQYGYCKFYYYDWHRALMHEAAEARVAAIVSEVVDCTMFHGLYRKQVLDDYFSDFHKSVSINNIFIDLVILAYAALRGKMFLLQNSNYIRIEPRDEESLPEAWRRILRAMAPDLPDDPKLVPFSIYRGQKAVLDKLKSSAGANQKIISAAYEMLSGRWAHFFA